MLLFFSHPHRLFVVTIIQALLLGLCVVATTLLVQDSYTWPQPNGCSGEVEDVLRPRVQILAEVPINQVHIFILTLILTVDVCKYSLPHVINTFGIFPNSTTLMYTTNKYVIAPFQFFFSFFHLRCMSIYF